MRKLLKVEMYELRHDYISFIMIAITLFFGVFSASDYISDNYLNLTQGGYQVFISMLYDSIALIIIISVFASVLVGKSFSNRSISLKITSGNSRRSVFLSKVISILIISTLSMLVSPISGAIIITIKYGWNVPILESIITLVKILICTISLEFSIFSVVIFWGIIFRDSFKTIIASAITSFMGAAYLFYARVLGLPLSMYPIQLLRTILKNNSTLQFISFSLEGIILLGCILTLSYKIFQRCELK